MLIILGGGSFGHCTGSCSVPWSGVVRLTALPRAFWRPGFQKIQAEGVHRNVSTSGQTVLISNSAYNTRRTSFPSPSPGCTTAAPHTAPSSFSLCFVLEERMVVVSVSAFQLFAWKWPRSTSRGRCGKSCQMQVKSTCFLSPRCLFFKMIWNITPSLQWILNPSLGIQTWIQ